jgi:hypothetical protein
MSSSPQQKVFAEDNLALEWRELEERRKELAAEIVKYLRDHGARSRKFPGKLAASGAEFELALTEAILRQIRDPKSLARFVRKCPKRMLKRAIERRVSWHPLANAEKFLMQHASAKVLKLYQAAVKTKKSKPRLTVRELPRRVAAKKGLTYLSPERRKCDS